MTSPNPDEVLLGRSKDLIVILDSYLKHGLPTVDTQMIRDILDVEKPYEPGEIPEPVVEVTE